MRVVALSLAACACALSGCSPDPQLRELLLEERAENRRLRQRIERPAPGGAAPEVLAQAAMAPMQEVLVELGKRQRELTERQAALTGEMRRWTTLLVDAAGAQKADEAAALAARLEALEKTIHDQDQRQREVEAMVGTALTRTADQLEAFLERLRAVGEAPQEPATPASSAAQEARSPEQQQGAGQTGPATGAGTTGEGRDALEGERQQQATMWPLWGVAVLAIVAGVWLLIPRRRSAASAARAMPFSPPEQDHSAALAPEPEPLPAAPPERASTPLVDGSPGLTAPVDSAPDDSAPVDEPEADELWTAAALLGEAIGRIKQSGGAVPAELQSLFEPAEAPAPEPGDASDEVEAGALPEPHPPAEREPDEAALQPPVRPSIPAASQRGPGPVRCRLRAADVAAAEGQVLELLGGDPRVLVQPAPEVHRQGDAVDVSYWLLPGVPDNERSLLEQRLRDAAL